WLSSKGTFESPRARHCTILHEIVARRAAKGASRRRKPHVKPTASRLGIAQEGLCARKRLTAFESGDRGLAGPHPRGQFGLGQARAQASPEQLGGNLELRGERVILSLDLRV